MFQQSIQYQPPVAIEGDFCSANPRASLLASAGGLISGPLGLIAGRFAWADNTGTVRGSGGIGRIGFVHRDNISLNTAWLGRSTMAILPNVEVNLFAAGEFWMRFAGGASPGQVVYANYGDGSAVAGAAGAPPTAGSATTSTITPVTSAITASISSPSPFNTQVQGGVLNVSAATAGTVLIGGILTGAGVASGNQIVNQLSGVTGGIGTYEVSIGQTVASESMNVTSGLFTAVGGLTGSFGVGDQLSGGTTVPGTTITALGTGVGGLGTYVVNTTQNVASATLTATAGVQTAWHVESYAAAGELAKTSCVRVI